MYKRRFTTPLHPSASNPAAPAASHTQPTNLSATESRHPVTAGAGASVPTAADTKENLPPATEDGVSKKPRLFARPAYNPPAMSAPAQTVGRPPAAPQANPAAASPDSRVFTVLYCKRDKWKVWSLPCMPPVCTAHGRNWHNWTCCVTQPVCVPTAEEKWQRLPGWAD